MTQPDKQEPELLPCDCKINPNEEFRSSVYWNPYNKVVQCHQCGTIYDTRVRVPSGEQVDSFQDRVQPWMQTCFGAEVASDKEERNHRFLEEALELVQSCGATRLEAHQLVDYVFDRAIDPPQREIGGVMVTLAALCLAQGFNMHECAEAELQRVWGKIKVIRAKQAAKPKRSPLPEHTATPSGGVAIGDDLKKRASQIIDAVFASPCVVETRTFSQPEALERLENQIVALLATTAPIAAPQGYQRRLCSKCGEGLGFSEGDPCDRCSVAAPEWHDEGGHAWEVRQNVTCVECPHCMFTFAAIHGDADSDGYSCPNCNGCPEQMVAAPQDEQTMKAGEVK